MTALHSIDDKQRLFTQREASGHFSCLGFDVCEDKITRYAAALGIPRPTTQVGTAEAFQTYETLVEKAHARFVETGKQLDAELTDQLRGLEGRRVEVVDCYGERRRFKVGKSTGWIPCHLEVHNSRSRGGFPVFGDPFKSVRVVR